MPADPTSRHHLAPRQRFGLRRYAIDNEAVLYDMAHDAVHYLNATARFIWDRCDGVRTSEAIAAELADAFDHDREDPPTREAVRADVCRTLSHLSDNGLIELDCRFTP